MSGPIKFLASLAVAVLVAGCAPMVQSDRLDPNAIAVQDVAIMVWMGDANKITNVSDHMKDVYAVEYKNAILNRLPEIFMKNGVRVQSMGVANAVQPAWIWPQGDIANTKASHILLLSALSVATSSNRLPNIRFSAHLWDTRTKKAVWRSGPQINLSKDRPLLVAEALAAELLDTMRKDGVITMKTERAVDMSGETIAGRMTAFMKDR